MPSLLVNKLQNLIFNLCVQCVVILFKLYIAFWRIYALRMDTCTHVFMILVLFEPIFTKKIY